MHSDIQELLKKGFVSLVMRSAGAVTSFALTVLVARTLGAQDSGYFFLAISITTILATFSRFGFDQTVTRFVGASAESQGWNEVNKLYRAVLPAVFGISLAISFVLFFGSDWISQSIFNKPRLGLVLHWMAWLVCLNAVCWMHGYFYQGLRDVLRFQWYQNFGLTCVFLTLVLLCKALLEFGFIGTDRINLELFCISYLFASAAVVTAALIGWMSKATFQWFRLETDRRKLFNVAIPFLGVAMMQQTITWTPQIILGVSRQTSEVGIYTAAFRTAQLTSLVLIACNSIALPKLAALYRDQEFERLKNVMVTSTRLLVLLCIPFLVLLLAFPGWIIGFFGDEFVAGSSALRILALGQLVNVSTGSVGGLLSMTGHQRTLLIGNAIALSVLLILSIGLIPIYGIMGAAVAQAVALSLQMGYFTFSVRSKFGFFPLTLRS